MDPGLIMLMIQNNDTFSYLTSFSSKLTSSSSSVLTLQQSTVIPRNSTPSNLDNLLISHHEITYLYDVCGQHGTCVSTDHGDNKCICGTGYQGKYCQQSINYCETMPCMNNGICINGLEGYECICEEGFNGVQCENQTRSCVQENLCKNGATCVDLGNSFNCIYRPGFDGQYCENEINECNSMPCYNNGTCKDLVNSFECDCPKGFIGTNCRINVNECASYPCSFGSTCIDRVGTYECICPEQRYGQHCDEVIIETEPKPPACNFYGRIYDHDDNWTYSCQRCHCNKGQIICTDISHPFPCLPDFDSFRSSGMEIFLGN
ncbi:Jagged [Schistosoma mansoni]|uniref:Jagged n=1 Tax=Schistosoma mansoni TaxID=6183 RepID=UPI00019B375F|nr:Jagged [Schistosoma mansoni]|eukprot:XP_018650604.1 Jagged [Schistosoma mansoni]